MAKKKSLFSALTSVPDNTTFDFVYAGQNYKIDKADLLIAMGATGTLVQKGEITGVPVLNKNGAENQIRNLIAGSGIYLSLSTEGGITLAHNVINGEGGANLIDDLTASQLTLKNLVAGDGITISGSSKAIQISAGGGPPVSTNTVIVNEMSDFPGAILGVITLAADTQYYIQNNLSTAYQFAMSDNTVLQGADSAVASLTYTSTLAMFTSLGNNTKIAGLTINAVTGTFLDWESVYGDGNQCLIRDSIVNAATLGRVDNCDGFSVFNTQLNCITDGLTFEGTNGFVSASDFVSALSAGKLFDFGTSVNDAISLRNGVVIEAAGTYFISGLVDSGNIAAGAVGNVINVRKLGAGGFSENIDRTDALWEFFHNDGIDDSINSLQAIKDSSTVVIAAANTPVIVGSTWVGSHASRFTLTAGGRFAYTGKGAHVNISGSISAIGVVPTSRNFQFLLYKNGVAISGAVFSRGFNNTGSGSISLVWQEDLVTGDYLELWVQNTETSDNLTINSVILGIDG